MGSLHSALDEGKASAAHATWCDRCPATSDDKPAVRHAAGCIVKKAAAHKLPESSGPGVA
jgi:hypothetical protein